VQEDKSDVLATGRDLLNFSQEAEGKTRYGRIGELFPFVYEASKRIGVRSISRWLAERGQPVSHSTISRALANSEAYWEALARQVEPHARQLMEAFHLPNYDFMFGPVTGSDGLNEYRDLCVQRYEEWVAAALKETDQEFERRAEHAIYSEPCEKFLSRTWFVLSEESREHCRKYFPKIKAEKEGRT
jgi:hypothetical protein